MCMSIRPGSTVWFDKSMTFAPVGISIDVEGPILEILSPMMTRDAEFIVVPSPMMTLSALITVTWSDCAEASLVVKKDQRSVRQRNDLSVWAG